MDGEAARELFDANAATYDRVNSIVSLGLDSRWREWVARRAMTRSGARVLDAFAGTGRVGIRVAELGGDVVLADVSAGMLAVAQARARDKGLRVNAAVTDLTATPLPVEGPFDAVTVMWGLRYLQDPAGVLRQLSTRLAPGGRVVVCDFVRPTRGVMPRLAAVYFFHVLPRIASALAGSHALYDALVSTTRAMGSREHLLSLVRDAGLEVVAVRVMGFGLVIGIVATPAPHDSATDQFTVT